MLEYLAIPADVGTSTARIWLGCRTRPDDQVWLEHAPSGARWPVGPWQRWTVPNDPARFIAHQRVVLDGLQPDTRYPLTLRVAGRVGARAEITTLPERLPPVGSPPLILMLGSCFCRSQDNSGRVGQAFARPGDGSRPRIKFLVGDQVYLDSPWIRFLRPHSARQLGTAFLHNYLETWGQTGDRQGFNHVLSAGANYFCSDDHEFWNNAPFPCSYATSTWTGPGRRRWWEQALALYRTFQADGPARIDIGSLSIRVLDTRIDRRPDRSTFVTPREMTDLAQWVSGLTSPGILVVGQPIFATRAGFKGRFADWNLPDFAQYGELCRVLQSSRQSILVVTGDVHYGRIATAQLGSGAQLVELISSPMALVDSRAGGSWHAAPPLFPADAIEEVGARIPVTTDAAWSRFANHFVTIELNQLGGGLKVRVRAWETDPPRDVLVVDRVLKKVA